MTPDRNGGRRRAPETASQWRSHRGAAATLFTAEHDGLVRYATKFVGPRDAEDVVQDVFLATGPMLATSRSPIGLLKVATANKSRDVLKHRTVEIKHGTIAGPTDVSDLSASTAINVGDTSHVDTERRAAAKMALQRVLGGLDELSQQQRDILALRVEGLSEVEIAEKLHMARGTVKNQSHRTRQKLAPFLEDFEF